MNNHSDIVGKIAQLHGLVNKTELNGAYVLIQAYLYDKNRFSVKPLPSPNGIDNTAEIAVKFESIKLCSQHNFHDRNADPMIMQVISLNATACELPDGSVLDLKTFQHTKKAPQYCFSQLPSYHWNEYDLKQLRCSTASD